MLCYQDMTFCCSKNCKNKCGRQLTEEIRQKAKVWWGSDEVPIAVAEFCDENGEEIKHGRE